MSYTYSLIANSANIARSDGADIPPDPANTDYQAYLAWVAAGNSVGAAPAPTQAQQIDTYNTAIQAALDSYAQSWGYTDVATACTYINSTSQKFKDEATALSGWRDAVWEWAEAALATVQAGGAAPTSETAFMSTMPVQPTRPAS